MGADKNNQTDKDQQCEPRNRGIFCRGAKKVFKSFDVELGGDRPGDIKVNDDRLYYLLFKFDLGLDRVAFGQAYVDGLWDCDDLLAFFEKAVMCKNVIFKKSAMRVAKMMHSLPLLTLNMQTKSRCKKDISFHYDLGNDLFKQMLDRSMNYSCGYWSKNVFLNSQAHENSGIKFNTLCENVDEAQLNKMYLIARKLKLEPGMKVLDIGCGWGYLAKFLAINFDVDVVGVTISKNQYEYATQTDLENHELEFLRIPGLKPKGEGSFSFKLQDYRDVKDTFDRIVSVGMLEHVGKKNYDEYFKIVDRCLKDNGLVLIQTIAVAHDYVPQVEPWANRYIFPGGMAPYPRQLVDATFGKFVIEDWHSMGYNYYLTLMAWHANFTKNWKELESNYDSKFKRMWVYFLLSSAALFKTRKLNNWQVVFSKDGHAGGYVSVR